ncbi:hypothetical protein [Methanoregula sp.]|uniref:hypothetical protein n=1 Tax=Methanoregula sp. TaxID=2052170 RepID=UPI0035642727
MDDDKNSGRTKYLKSPILAGIAGGLLLAAVISLTNLGWRDLVGYNGWLSGPYGACYTTEILLVFIFSGALSVFFIHSREDREIAVLRSGILSGIMAGLVFGGTFPYLDILLDPARYHLLPGILPGLMAFLEAAGFGWFMVVCASVLTGMVFAATGALLFRFLRQRLAGNSGSRDNDYKTGILSRTILLALLTGIVAVSLVPPAVAMIGIAQGTIAHEPPALVDPLPATPLPVQSVRAGCTTTVSPWMQQNAGQDVPAGEYLDVINPGSPDTVPQDTRDAYYRMVVRVPGYPNASEGMQDPSPGGLTYGSRSAAIAVAGYREIPDGQQNADAGNRSGQCHMNESTIEGSNRLAGQEITIGKYFETVCPDYLAGMPESEKEPLYNQTLQVPEIPPDHEGTVAFVPPLSVSGIRMEYSPGWAMTLCGIAGLGILVMGYVIVRRYP